MDAAWNGNAVGESASRPTSLGNNDTVVLALLAVGSRACTKEADLVGDEPSGSRGTSARVEEGVDVGGDVVTGSRSAESPIAKDGVRGIDVDDGASVASTSKDGTSSANGAAVPGRRQQFSAIASIKKRVPKDVYLYSAFNNYWLADNAGTFGAEHYWGLLEG